MIVCSMIIHDETEIDGEWYYKEEFDPDTADMDDYVTTVPMALDDDDTSPHDDDAEIDEKVLQKVIRWLNEKRAFNMDWREFDRAHFQITYFHFASLKRAVVFYSIDHALVDGVMVATLISE